MKILYFVPLFWPDIGGIETLSMRAIPLLKQKGHEFVIVTSNSELAKKPKDKFKEIPIYRFPMIEAIYKRDIQKLLIISKKIKEVIQDFKPDLIHVHFGGIPISIFLLKEKLYNIPILLTLHSGIEGMKVDQNTLLGKLLHRSTWITAVSDSVLESAIKSMPELNGKISRIYNGVSLPSINPADLDFLKPNILCIGRMVKEKGFDIMLKAFKEINKVFSNVNLIFAGDGPIRKDLEEIASKYGLLDRIQFLGWVEPDEIFNLINKSEIIVVPSRWEEPFGLVAIEAALLKRPVIATRVGGLKEIIEDGVTGMLFEKDDVNGLVDNLHYLLSNPQQAIKLGQKAREHAISNFSMDSFIEQYHKLYIKLGKGKKDENN